MDYSNILNRYLSLVEYSSLPLTTTTATTHSIYLLPLSPPTDYYGVIFIHSDLYKGGIFRFSLTKSGGGGGDYKVQFKTELFHPLVGRDGRLNKTSTTTTTTDLSSTLSYISSIFTLSTLATTSLSISDCLNIEAFKMYQNEMELYSTLARQCAILSTQDPSLYERVGAMMEMSEISSVRSEELKNKLVIQK